MMGGIQQYCSVFTVYDPNSHITEKHSWLSSKKGPVEGSHRHDSHSITGSGDKPSLKGSSSDVTYQKKGSAERQRPANRAWKRKEKAHYMPQPKSNEIMEH